jgi:hypothetical protein
VGGREDLGDAARRRPVDALGHRHQLALVDRRELGLPAAADDRHHAIALGEARSAGAVRHDLAGELEPRNVLRRAGRSGVRAAALEHVRPVQTGRAHADEHLARPRGWVGMLFDDQFFVPNRDCAHDGRLWWVVI